MLIHEMRAFEKSLEGGIADVESDGEADRRPQRVAAPDPLQCRHWNEGDELTSQNSNMFASSMPKSRTFGPFVDSATKCRAIALRSPPNACKSQSRADSAFVIVSCVVKVFDAMMKSVVSGETRFNV